MRQTLIKAMGLKPLSDPEMTLKTPIKMIFWPNLCVGGEVQVLGIL